MKTNLLTVAEFKKLRKGAVLVSITGRVVTVGKDAISTDTRGGRLAYSVEPRTVADLRKVCRARKYKGYSRLTKARLADLVANGPVVDVAEDLPWAELAEAA